MGAQTALVLLFIGNSLSAWNDLPSMLEAMGQASGLSIRCTIVAKPNFSLEDHWKDPAGDARRAIARGGWTRVIMQQGPSSLPSSRVLLHEYAKRLDVEIRKAGGKPAMLTVWPAGARRGDFEGVVESYRGAASAIDGDLFAAGAAWRAAWVRDPSLALYGPDGFHPSRLGSYLTALVVFHGLTGRLPDPVTVAGVSPREAEICRAAVLDIATARTVR